MEPKLSLVTTILLEITLVKDHTHNPLVLVLLLVLPMLVVLSLLVGQQSAVLVHLVPTVMLVLVPPASLLVPLVCAARGTQPLAQPSNTIAVIAPVVNLVFPMVRT